MIKIFRPHAAAVALLLSATLPLQAQSFLHYASTPEKQWQQLKSVKASSSSQEGALVVDNKTKPISEFRAWGTTFNERDWQALCLLTRDEQNEILHRAFSPGGDLKFSKGRISMNANDYALDWYACSTVPGDFSLTHFNIERDKMTIIPYIRAAQAQNSGMRFWMSPWSPPAWMKINNHYAVQSNRYNDLDPRLDVLLYGDGDRSVNEQVNPDKHCFPRRLAVQDYMIQDPRYLQAYADMFCRFIDLYGEQGVPIEMVMYQNEAYSYTPYPGCPWTAEGILRFNLDYLAPTLRKKHPQVELCLGTFNTNRYDHVKQLLSDGRMPQNIKGVGFQWEGGQILPRIRKEYPQYRYISTESECGNGNMDWKAAEHTFHLINHYLGNGCSEYYNWNLILCDKGESRWGWRQNALIRVNSGTRKYEYVPEYFAYKHYSQFIQAGAKILAYQPSGEQRMPILVSMTPQGKYIVVAANAGNEARTMRVQLGKNVLTCTLEPHSMHTFSQK